ncbi:MAG TPA: pyridoxamine 5'-phosphate oxidase family protein [bacterium]|nr:pyridoxamine 5'-phosphate oxidase family protein [bacterium]
MSANPDAIDGRLAEALHGNNSARFLATLGEDGRPNLVPALSAVAANDRLVRVAAILPDQPRINIANNPHVALLVIDQSMRWWSLAMHADGYEAGKPGDKVGRWLRLEQQNIVHQGTMGRLALAAEYGLVRALGIPKGESYADLLPQQIARKLSTLKAIKALAYVDAHERVSALPCLSLVPAGPGALVCGTRVAPQIRAIPVDTPVAVGLLTFEPNAYQILGWFEGAGGGLLRTNVTIRVLGMAPALASKESH